jgi:uncharacterized membrane protein YraQ (UPF0718 family)
LPDRAAIVAASLLCLCTLFAASLWPPAVVEARVAPLLVALGRAWYFFSSMMLGAAPFLASGALTAAAANRIASRPWGIRLPSWCVAVCAAVLAGCDCSLNALAPALRAAPPALSGFALVWGACCNPLALAATAAVLGPHMLACRVLAGLIASVMTALLWSRSPHACASHGRGGDTGVVGAFARAAAVGTRTFAIAAGVSALVLTFAGNGPHGRSMLLATIAGALLSPCSSADALLARVLFSLPAAQLAFIVAAQCLDTRQLFTIYRTFGAGPAVRTALGAVLGLCVGSALVGT